MSGKSDPVMDDLDALEASLLRDADAAGENPDTRSKSSFKSEADKADWIGLFGLDAYRRLPD